MGGKSCWWEPAKGRPRAGRGWRGAGVRARVRAVGTQLCKQGCRGQQAEFAGSRGHPRRVPEGHSPRGAGAGEGCATGVGQQHPLLATGTRSDRDVGRLDCPVATVQCRPWGTPGPSPLCLGRWLQRRHRGDHSPVLPAPPGEAPWVARAAAAGCGAAAWGQGCWRVQGQ